MLNLSRAAYYTETWKAVIHSRVVHCRDFLVHSTYSDLRVVHKVPKLSPSASRNRKHWDALGVPGLSLAGPSLLNSVSTYSFSMPPQRPERAFSRPRSKQLLARHSKGV